jgi:hypothetical protein
MLDITIRRALQAPILASFLLLAACSKSGGGNPSPAGPLPAAMSITTTSLPNGQVGRGYSAALKATGGKAPLSWTVSSGALPAGLTLAAASGMISGTPTATAAAVPITFTVTDSSATAQKKSVALKLNVSPAVITVSISPTRAAVVVTQSLTLASTTNDYAGVSWSVSPAGGSFTVPSSASGQQIKLTAPSSAGLYTVTATSVTNSSQSASITIGVTDLAGVYTYHNDLARDGVNMQEYALTPTNVNSTTFGKLFSCTVDGAVYAQPLWVANLSIGGSRHNVVVVATQHDSLYAFDADTKPCLQLWNVSLIDTNHGATAGESSVPSGVTGYLVGKGFGDITPEAGVTGTPVIDPMTGVLYVVSKSVNPAGPTLYQRLHAIDLATGKEKTGSPIAITAAVPGAGDGGTTVKFEPGPENQRAGLALVGGVVYIAWGAHEDTDPWYGWIAGYTYSGSGFKQTAVFNTAPDARRASVWMSGAAPSADNFGKLYVITGNGAFDITNTSGPHDDYGDCFLQLNSALGVSSWFTPSDEENDYSFDNDFGAGGAAIVLNLSTGPLNHLVVGGGKDGTLYLLNGDHLGGAGDSNALQSFPIGTGGPNSIFGTAAFWNNTLFLAPVDQPMLAYAFDTSADRFIPAANPTPTSQSPHGFAFPGSTPSVSASGPTTNGIVWAIKSQSYCTAQSSGCGPAVLYAYDATNLANELWNSSMIPADAAGNAVKFTVPTVANGRVYVGTRGNNVGGVYGSTTISGELDVYGLKPD